jgi:hypothetical protein
VKGKAELAGTSGSSAVIQGSSRGAGGAAMDLAATFSHAGVWRRNICAPGRPSGGPEHRFGIRGMEAPHTAAGTGPLRPVRA